MYLCSAHTIYIIWLSQTNIWVSRYNANNVQINVNGSIKIQSKFLEKYQEVKWNFCKNVEFQFLFYPVSLFKFPCQNYCIMLQLSRGAILHSGYYFRNSASDA